VAKLQKGICIAKINVVKFFCGGGINYYNKQIKRFITLKIIAMKHEIIERNKNLIGRIG
jgi:hypothetical protein